MLRLSRIHAAGLFAFLIMLLSIQSAWFSTRTFVGLDFYNIWMLAQSAIIEKGENPYSEASRTRIGEYYMAQAAESQTAQRHQVVAQARRRTDPTGTPFFYTAFRPFLTGEYERDYSRHHNLSLALFALAICFMARSLRLGWTAAFACVALLTHFSLPHRSEINVGNVNQIQVALLALFLFLRRIPRIPLRDLISAAWLGLVIAFKPNLAPIALAFLIFALANRRYRKALFSGAGLLGGFLIAFLISCLALGNFQAWNQWSEILPKLLQADYAISAGNYGIARILIEWKEWDLSRLLFLFCTISVAFAAWLGRRPIGHAAEPNDTPGREYNEDFLAVALGSTIMLLSSRLVWLHYYILLAPTLIFLIRPETGASPLLARYPLRITAAGLAILLLSTIVLHKPEAWDEGWFWASRTAIAAIIAFAAILMESAGRPRPLETPDA